jgi:hypothetical protein
VAVAGAKACLCLLSWIGITFTLSRAISRRWSSAAIAGSVWLGCAILVTALANGSSVVEKVGSGLRALFLPESMAILALVSIFAGAIYAFFGEKNADGLVIALIGCCGLLLAFRCLLLMRLMGYPVFYNQLVLVAYALTVVFIGRLLLGKERPLLISLLFVPVLITGMASTLPEYQWSPRELLRTDRGSIFVAPYKAAAYREAIDFMRHAKALGHNTISMPEDVSLYFLSGVNCPLRMYMIPPFLLDPGQPTTEYLSDFDSQKIDYVLLSNRKATEYGLSFFGEDYNQRIMQHVNLHFVPVGTIGDYDDDSHWGVRIYERKDVTARVTNLDRKSDDPIAKARNQ